ncbi:hypothetical protein GIS00_18925 [Nakamurella sp. YIM 132087]|uniref:Uncharacterized protein n=1 Tax=Nakamurella alba TaxID=2665158 RepID=A0A7K1FT80_9ACTN|nr:hypothetical protein [Nakamurella alba]MTD16014.1 hypothetical protein [Nakamurella alba]
MPPPGPAAGEPDPKAEQVLQQALRAMAGGPKPAADASRNTPAARGSRGQGWTDRTLILVIGAAALVSGAVLGVISLWLF